MDKSGNATNDNFQLAGDDDDDDSRTIIDCGELFFASERTPLIRLGLNEAHVPLDGDREGVGAADDDRDNRKSRGISAAKPELAFCGNFSKIEASKTRRKRRLSTDRPWKAGLSDEKRLKTEDDLQTDTTISGQEQEKTDKEIDDEKDPITRRSPKTHTNGFDEVAKPIIDRRSSILDGAEQEQERGEGGSEEEDFDRDLKYRNRRIQWCASARQTEHRENGDEDLEARRADTILVIPSYRNLEISQNATECNNDKSG